ncbi:hypothetical protein Patl1_07493 [Pistacia atlantica]|uniref:Uncharacterized protein n=1 Tax=Pistacia atlantica TaxID=434234 RepID=A0ACC1AGN1_9ROSI|nr:hypothetical protein Patl1_07493 [Pistacia atlantica]
MDRAIFEDLDVVILFVHFVFKKGMKSVVLEKSESLRAPGRGWVVVVVWCVWGGRVVLWGVVGVAGGIAIQPNGWKALDVLGVGSKLRPSTILLQRIREIFLNGSKQQEEIISYS